MEEYPAFLSFGQRVNARGSILSFFHSRVVFWMASRFTPRDDEKNFYRAVIYAKEKEELSVTYLPPAGCELLVSPACTNERENKIRVLPILCRRL